MQKYRENSINTRANVLKDKPIKNKVKINYQKKLDELILSLNGEVKSILLHSCCAPCSSYCVEYLSKHFKITVLFYNPNIHPREEYFRRLEEQKTFIKNIKSPNGVDIIEGDYDTKAFYERAANRAFEREGGPACLECYHIRLKKAAELAKDIGYDYFATTLSISPHKNSQDINAIGEDIAREVGVMHLPSDFKKKNGFKRSVELSDKLGLYRQDYCGCVYSKRERDLRFKKIEEEIAQNEGSKIIVTGCCEDCRHRQVSVLKR